MAELDAEALKQRVLGIHPPKEWYPLGEHEILALIADKERAQERLEQTDQVIRQVKDENEQLRRVLAWWDQHLPSCAKWVHVTERVGSLDVCNGEDILDEDKACSCGYDERWTGLAAAPEPEGRLREVSLRLRNAVGPHVDGQITTNELHEIWREFKAVVDG